MNDVAVPDVVSFIENNARQRSTHYRKEAARFRDLADHEPITKVRRHLVHLAREYDNIAGRLEVSE